MADNHDYRMGDSPLFDHQLGCMVRPSQRQYLCAAQAVNSGGVRHGPTNAQNFVPAPKPPEPQTHVMTDGKTRKQRDLTDEEAAIL